MSCIAGILNLDGAPVDRELMQRMTGAMKDRAPDASNVWISGNVGLGHALLRISPESENEHQPCSLDGQVWITADARIDGRTDLTAKLKSAGAQVNHDAPDVDLILHAYAAFGEKFLDHLIGDFAFALWDGRSKKLICARDHFGIRPFYYIKTERFFVFASDIRALVVHPAFSGTLDEDALGDFLLFGSYMGEELTVYRDVRCLPSATYGMISLEASRLVRHWQLPERNEVRYKHDSEYVDHFLEIFGVAVRDRIRTARVAIELSGGMDSTAIAAAAALKTSAPRSSLTAYTTTCNQLFPDDQEGRYAGMVAEHLGIPINFQATEDYPLFERFGTTGLRTAQPVATSALAARYDTCMKIKLEGIRVLLSGYGGDAVFAGSSTYYSNLLYGGRIIKLLAELYGHVRHTGSLAGTGLRAALFARNSMPSWQPPFPDWMDADFTRRAHLHDRWKAIWQRIGGVNDDYHQLRHPWLGHGFQSFEAINAPLVIRHPFFDIRMVAFLMGLPNYLRSNKRIMREGMRGKLPEVVRKRPKTSLVGDLTRTKIERGLWVATMESSLDRVKDGYIDQEKYMNAFNRYLEGAGIDSTWFGVNIITPIALNYWLKDNTK